MTSSQTEKTIPGPAAQKLSGKSASILAWILIFALLLVQYFLFRQYVVKEVAGSYPRVFDQAVFLDASYETYDRIVHQGLVRGLRFGAGFDGGSPSPNGALIHLQAALLYRLFGPGRLTALSLGFIYFALFQVVLATTVRELSGRWSTAFIAVGLLLAARTTFQETGGIIDFRIEFIAFCLFGIFACFVLRSNAFAKFGWTLAAALVAAYTIAFRFITTAYFGPMFCLFVALVVFDAVRFRSDEAARALGRRRLRNLAISAAIGVLMVAPVIWHHWQSVFNYYLRFHASGEQRYIRAAGFGALHGIRRWTYYPQSILLHHAGAAFITLALTLAVARFLVFPIQRSRQKRRWTFANPISLLLVCLLVPLLALTLDLDRNAGVAGILMGPLLLLAMLPWLADLKLDTRIGRISRSALAGAIAIVSLSVGVGVQAFSYTRHTRAAVHRDEEDQILALYDQIESVSRKNKWESPIIASDSFCEYLFIPAINVMVYERHGYRLHARASLAVDLVQMPPDQIRDAVSNANFVMIIRPSDGEPPVPRTPFDRSMDAARELIAAYCDAKLEFSAHIRALGRDVTLYARDEKSERK